MRPRAWLVHELVGDARNWWRAAGVHRATRQVKQPWDEKDYKIPAGPVIAEHRAAWWCCGDLAQRTRGLYPAPEAISRALVEGAQVDFDTALRIESRISQS